METLTVIWFAITFSTIGASCKVHKYDPYRNYKPLDYSKVLPSLCSSRLPYMKFFRNQMNNLPQTYFNPLVQNYYPQHNLYHPALLSLLTRNYYLEAGLNQLYPYLSKYFELLRLIKGSAKHSTSCKKETAAQSQTRETPKTNEGNAVTEASSDSSDNTTSNDTRRDLRNIAPLLVTGAKMIFGELGLVPGYPGTGNRGPAQNQISQSQLAALELERTKSDAAEEMKLENEIARMKMKLEFEKELREREHRADQESRMRMEFEKKKQTEDDEKLRLLQDREALKVQKLKLEKNIEDARLEDISNAYLAEKYKKAVDKFRLTNLAVEYPAAQPAVVINGY